MSEQNEAETRRFLDFQRILLKSVFGVTDPAAYERTLFEQATGLKIEDVYDQAVDYSPFRFRQFLVKAGFKYVPDVSAFPEHSDVDEGPILSAYPFSAWRVNWLARSCEGVRDPHLSVKVLTLERVETGEYQAVVEVQSIAALKKALGEAVDKDVMRAVVLAGINAHQQLHEQIFGKPKPVPRRTSKKAS